MKKLYVGNVPYNASEGDLQNWFTEAGFAAARVNIVRDRYSGEPRGFAFVEMDVDEDAERAIRTLNGKDLLGRTLVVNEARPPREGGRGGGGGGGFRGGRGGGGGGGGGGRRRSW